MATNGGDSSPPTTALERLGRTALLGLFVLALAGGAALLMRQAAPSGVEIILPTPTPPPSLEVYLTGAVARPDTYAFRDGDRLADVLKMAGGANADADLSQVNLALRLSDQEHFHVPRKGETVRLPERQGLDNGLVDLNRAGSEELQRLPGIGPTRAESIVEHRSVNGPFQSVEELLAVAGIGPSTLEGLRDLVAVE